MPASPSARTIRCDNCKASIEVAGLSPTVTCSYCGHTQQVDPALLSKLGDYSEAVGEQIATAEKERQHAASWDRSVAQMSGARRGLNYLLGFGLMGGLPVLAAIGGILLMKAGVIPENRPQYISFACMGSAMLGVVIYFVWYFTAGQKAKATAAPVTSVTCPSCGAPNAMQAGQVLETCLHCGAALIPSDTVQRQAVDAARGEATRARLERYRAERSGMAAVQSYGIKGTLLVWIVGGSFLVPIGGMTAIFTFQMIAGKERFSPGILALWGLLLAALGVMGTIVWFQKRRKLRIRRGLEALVTRFGGRILGGLPGTVGWLNTHWAGPFDVHDMTQSSYNDSAALTVEGYPALVDLDPIPAARQIRPRALVLVACDIPGVEDGRGDTLRLSAGQRILLEKIKAAGFDVEIQQGGLLARGDAMLARRIASSGGAVADLASVLQSMTRLSGSLSGVSTIGDQ